MANNTQEFKTIISLNAKQAKDELKQLNDRVDNLKKKKDDALKNGGGWSKQDAKDLKQATAAAKAYESTVSKTINTLTNMQNASVGEVKSAMRSLKKIMNDTTDPKDYQALEKFLDQCKLRISGMSDATRLTADEMRNLMNESQLVAKVLDNMDTSSLKELRDARAALQKGISRADPTSDVYKQQEESLQKVQRRIGQIEAEQKSLNSLVDGYDNEIKSCQRSTKEIHEQDKIIEQTLNNISQTSLKKIELALEMVNDQLKYTDQGTEKFKKLTEESKRLSTQIEIINGKSKDTRSIWSKISGFFNTNWGFFTQALGAITGLTVTIRKCTQAYAEMDDTMVDVMKYTGQTKEEVESMNEDFKNMNTRTSREELNELAGAAGRLGKQSKSDIEEFVEAADKINVALGDDLGKGAVDKIGKLASVFGEESRLGLKQAMLSTGSAINELAQSSSANAGYIVDFTADLAGVGRQANMTQAQIMGLASALDQNMQEEATASTVFSQLITKMFQDPAKFANIAGIEVAQFTKLLKTDANEALLQFMQSMQDKGGFAEMAPMFESMNLNGTRAVGVLSSVATHLDQVRVAQTTATQAYKDGTSVLNEFNTNNNTVNAELDKAKKRFNDLTIELGEKLIPVAKLGITSTSLIVSALRLLSTVISKGVVTIGLLTASIAAYTAVVNASVIKTKLLAFWNDKVVASFQKIFAVMKANPWGVAIAGAALLVGILADMARRSRELTRTQEELAKIENNASEKAVEESNRLERLRKVVNDNNRSVKERQAAIREIQKVIPNYIASVNGEGDAYLRNTELLNDYIKKLKEKALVEGAKEEMKSLGKEIAHTQMEVAKQEEAIRQRRKEIASANSQGPRPVTTSGANVPSQVIAQTASSAELAGMEARLSDLRNKAKGATDAMETLSNKFGKVIAENDLAGSGNGGSYGGGNGGGNGGGASAGNGSAGSGSKNGDNVKDIIQKELDDAKKITEQIQAENAIRYYTGEIDYREYMKQQRLITINGLQSELDVYKKHGETSKQLEAELAKEQYGQREDESMTSIALLDKQYAEEQLKTKAQMYDRNSALYNNEDAVNEVLFQKQIEYLDKKKSLQIAGSEEQADTQAEIDELEQQHKFELAQRHEQKIQQYREQFGKQNVEVQEKIALDGFDAICKAELAKYKDNSEEKLKAEKDFQEMRKQMVLYYQEQESVQNLNNSSGEQFKRNADTAYQTAKNNANADFQNDHPTGTGVMDYVASDVTIFSSTIGNIKQMEKDAVISHEEAMAAMGQATADMCAGIASKMQAAYDAVSPIMDAMSSYYSAQCDLEVTQTEKKYEKLIDRAGNNQAKQKKLQEKQEKEIAKIKTKYNKKQVKMQIAQAIAQSAMSAISAYASVMAGAPWPANQILAPIAAGLALAAGAIQIATIKKQAQAQEAGYYEGGFTGGSSYRREAGVVHEGEFVANHNTVNNQQLLPALELIDYAQRHNTVGSLTALDVSRSMGVGGTAIINQTPIVVNNDNSELAGTLQQARKAFDRLGSLLESGDIVVKMPDWDDFDRSRRHYDRLQANK